MSETASAMLGNDLAAVATIPSQGALKHSSASSEQSEHGEFAALFSAFSAPSGEAGSVINPDLSPLSLLPVAEPVGTESLHVQQTSLQATLPYGNSLPGMLPQMAISGHIANAGSDGAQAIRFVGDGAHLLLSSAQQGADIPLALQAANKQLDQSLGLTSATAQNGFTDLLANAQRIPQTGADPLAVLQNDPEHLLLTSSAHQTNPSHVTASFLAAMDTVQGNTHLRPEPMTATLQQPHWNQEFTERVNWIIAQGLKQAEIRLNPPELGLLEVRVQLQGDQANVHFSSPHAQVRDAIDAALPRLREMLAETGLSLGDANVSQHSFTNQQSTEDGRQQRQTGYGPANEATELDALTATSFSQGIHANGMLDVFA